MAPARIEVALPDAEPARRLTIVMSPDEWGYRLEPSTGPDLPQPPDFKSDPGGAWVALDVEGQVVGRFADSPEPEDGEPGHGRPSSTMTA